MTLRLRPVERELLLASFAVPTQMLEDWTLDRLTSIAEERLVRRGDVLWTAGRPVDSLYFMRDGRVRMTRPGAAPWVFEGQWFLGSFEGRRAEVARRNATALADFHALRVSAKDWYALLEDSFDLTRSAVVAAANAVARLDERVPDGVIATPRLEVLQRPAGRPLEALGRLAVLAELEMARGAGIQALGELAAASTEIVLEEGQALRQTGDAHEHFFLVAAGTVEARRVVPDVTRTYRAGQVVAGAAAFTDRVQEWSASASARARVIAVPIEAWFDLMEDHFDLAHSFLGVLGTWRERALDWLAEAAGPEGIVLR